MHTHSQRPMWWMFQAILIVIPAISILAAVLFPAFAKARENWRLVRCLENLKTSALAFRMYTEDYGDSLPSSAACGTKSWSEASDLRFRTTIGAYTLHTSPPQARTFGDLMVPYLHRRNRKLLFCPSDPASRSAGPVSYILKKSVHQAWWGAGMPESEVARKVADFRQPADQTLLYERCGWHFGDAAQGDMSVTAKGGVSLNMAFTDGHVATKRLPDPLNGEPDFYNLDARTGKPVDRMVDPRRYVDELK